MKTRRASLLGRFLVIVAGMIAIGQTAAVEFKGVKLGAPLRLSQESEIFGSLDCNPMQMSAAEYRGFIEEMQFTVPGARKVCAASTSIATVPADATVILGASRRVLRITFHFDGADYARVVEAMTAKWGAGVEEVRDLNDESIWWDFDDDSTVSIHKSPVDNASEHPEMVQTVALAEYSIAVLTPTGDL